MFNDDSVSFGSFHLLARGDVAQLESLALVLEAVGIDPFLQEGDSSLWVAESDVAKALEQLHLYQTENLDWPPVDKIAEPHPQVPPTVLVMGGLALFYLFTGEWNLNSPWFQQGAVDARAVSQGQWWRLVTGLTLHADTVHLLGNCCLGGVLVHLLSRAIGYGLTWALLIGTGTLGNWCNLVARQSPHLSVGFSTAVFAAVGIFSGMQVFRHRQILWKDLLLSLGSGLALLALLGTEGERTDLGAHFFGFVLGALIGLPLAIQPVLAWFRPAYRQRFLFAGAFLFVLFCWWRAMG